MTPVGGARTPSSVGGTPRADRLRRPLESPFPSPPAVRSPASAAASPSSPPSTHSLSDRHLREIRTVFRIFDPTLSGFVDVPTFEVLVRSLGFRMTRVEVAGMAEAIWEERRRQRRGQTAEEEADAGERRRIDLPAAIQILSRRGYARRSAEDEARMYFRIFDGGNKGHITLEDLRRVQDEARAAEGEMGIGPDADGADAGLVGHATLWAMIEQFDRNGDGVIDYEEFKEVLAPMLSTSSGSL